MSASSIQIAAAITLFLPDPAATEALGLALVPLLRPGLVLTLEGPLGSGKTALVRALLHGLGHSGRVRSPTYTLVEPYELPWGEVFHFDFYRLASGTDPDDAGFREHFSGAALCCVEWPQQAAGWLPPADLSLRITSLDTGRSVSLEAGERIDRAAFGAAMQAFLMRLPPPPLTQAGTPA